MDGTGVDCPLGMRVPNMRLRKLDVCDLTVHGKQVTESLSDSGVGGQSLIVGGPTGAITIKRLTAGTGVTLSSDANQITINATLKMADRMGTYTWEGVGGELAAAGVAAAGPVTLTANRVVYIPMRVTDNVTVYKISFTAADGAGAGNVDVGLYDSTGNLLTHSGSTAVAGVQQTQVIDVPDVNITPGTYYLAIVETNVAGQVIGSSLAATDDATAYGIKIQSATFPLPATATFAEPLGIASFKIPDVVASLLVNAI